MFEINEFLSQSFDDVPPDRSTPIPVGDYNVQVDTGEKGIKLAQGTTKDGKSWKRLDLRCLIADPAGQLKETHGETPSITYGIMLDLDDNDRLDLGPNRNVKLGKVLEAAGKRKPGWKVTDLYGAAFRIKIGHEPHPQDPTIVLSKVVAVTAPV